MEVTWRFVPIESRRLVTLALEAGDGQAGVLWPEMWDGALEGAVVKATIHADADHRVDVASVKRALYEAGAYKVASVSLDVEREERARVEGLTEEIDEMQALRLWMAANQINGTREAALVERHEKYAGRVGAGV